VLKHTGEALTSVCIPSSCRGIAPEQNVGEWIEQRGGSRTANNGAKVSRLTQSVADR